MDEYARGEQAVIPEEGRPATAEQALKALGITLPSPPRPFGSYVEAVQN
jgi:hypothetical protein